MYGYPQNGKIIALQSDESYAATDESVKILWVVVPVDLQITYVDGAFVYPEADASWVNPDAANLPPFPPPAPAEESDEPEE